jgi:hypothetical protein
VIKHFTTVIYCHFKVTLSFCVIKLFYHGNYCRMIVYYHGICVTNIIKHNLTLNVSTKLQYGSELPQYFNSIKRKVKITAVIYRAIFITLAPSVKVIKLLTAVIYCHSMTILSFCVIKRYNLGNYHRMAVNWHAKMFCNIGPWWQS